MLFSICFRIFVWRRFQKLKWLFLQNWLHCLGKTPIKCVELVQVISTNTPDYYFQYSLYPSTWCTGSSIYTSVILWVTLKIWCWRTTPDTLHNNSNNKLKRVGLKIEMLRHKPRQHLDKRAWHFHRVQITSSLSEHYIYI